LRAIERRIAADNGLDKHHVLLRLRADGRRGDPHRRRCDVDPTLLHVAAGERRHPDAGGGDAVDEQHRIADARLEDTDAYPGAGTCSSISRATALSPPYLWQRAPVRE
jgi:hypothetical protein